MLVKRYPCKKDTSETIVFSSGLGGHANFWLPQIEYFAEHYNVVCYEQDGVLPNSELLSDSYSMQDLAEQLIKILEKEGLSNCHFVGHALGGFIGIEVANKAPELLDKLVILNGWERLDPHTIKCFNMRKSLIEDTGIEAFVRAQAIFLYPPIWISNNIEALTQKEDAAIASFPPVENVLTRLKALQSYQPLINAKHIKNPTLVLSNLDDVLVPWQRGLALAENMQNAQFELMVTGGHASTISETCSTNSKILEFLSKI
ncbi:pyrimidine utilization protein D [Psychrobacter sp.]|uniref:pyrimidine utilization protein D n=1 Tax=Psychrobacter sp. TaxID=56811 RepID=UPI0026497575|nr:pyrimidine utilization protein D [Psychrobacter sp.]MDN6308405.1 pyrimidine utilization protein D [Psychrobacter sp.]